MVGGKGKLPYLGLGIWHLLVFPGGGVAVRGSVGAMEMTTPAKMHANPACTHRPHDLQRTCLDACMPSRTPDGNGHTCERGGDYV